MLFTLSFFMSKNNTLTLASTSTLPDEITILVVDSLVNNANTADEVKIIKSTPKISVKTTKVKSKDALSIYLKNSSGNPLKSKKLTASIGGKKYSLTTDSKGVANLNINLAAKTHKLTVSFEGDDKFNPVIKQFNIKVSKLSTKITCYTNFVVRGNNLYFYLTDQNSNAVSGKKIIIKYKGKTLTKKTNKNGRIACKIKAQPSTYSITIY